MLNPTIFVLLASAGLIEGRSVFDTTHVESRHMHGHMDVGALREPRRIHAFVHKRQNNNDASGTTLLANAIQTGSFSDGSVNGVQKPGQSASKTSKNNFINLCAGKELTNGLQVIGGSCNGIRKFLYLNMPACIADLSQLWVTSQQRQTWFPVLSHSPRRETPLLKPTPLSTSPFKQPTS